DHPGDQRALSFGHGSAKEGGQFVAVLVMRIGETGAPHSPASQPRVDINAGEAAFPGPEMVPRGRGGRR
ncbi:MAG: hypothetical protein ACRECR_04260, partial [Thermoplasmata archaeon]